MAFNRRSVSTDHDACGVGFIAQLGSTGSHEVVERALEALLRLAHRGGVDADGRSGDGAGLLTAIPEKFMRRRALEAGVVLPAQFALGMVFLPRGQEEAARSVIETTALAHGLRCVGWRVVPANPTVLGPRASETVPAIEQCFLAPLAEMSDLEAALFHLR